MEILINRLLSLIGLLAKAELKTFAHVLSPKQESGTRFRVPLLIRRKLKTVWLLWPEPESHPAYAWRQFSREWCRGSDP